MGVCTDLAELGGRKCTHMVLLRAYANYLVQYQGVLVIFFVIFLLFDLSISLNERKIVRLVLFCFYFFF